uniref:Uncharacterized protein LOC100176248 n=1 Tax=Phallusia mammillata TaxID=59560 RepID=A0A6F9DGY6_9ASCI|nr:uncharacterized protein LOC100176248 [Phallusia mammillata]
MSEQNKNSKKSETKGKWNKTYDSNRHYKVAWEKKHPWARKSETGEEAYCKICQVSMPPKRSRLADHEVTKKHKKRMTAASMSGKLNFTSTSATPNDKQAELHQAVAGIQNTSATSQMVDFTNGTEFMGGDFVIEAHGTTPLSSTGTVTDFVNYVSPMKRKSTNDLEPSLQGILKEPQTSAISDEDQLFMLSCVAEMKRLPKQNKTTFKIEVLKLLATLGE